MITSANDIQYVETIKNNNVESTNLLSSTNVQDIYRQDDDASEAVCKAMLSGPSYILGGVVSLISGEGDPTELGEATLGAIESNHVCENDSQPINHNATTSNPDNHSTYLGGANGNSKPETQNHSCNGMSYNASNC